MVYCEVLGPGSFAAAVILEIRGREGGLHDGFSGSEDLSASRPRLPYQGSASSTLPRLASSRSMAFTEYSSYETQHQQQFQ